MHFIPALKIESFQLSKKYIFYYTLFLHYHHSLTSITQSPIVTKFNAFELGIMLKAKDLF